MARKRRPVRQLWADSGPKGPDRNGLPASAENGPEIRETEHFFLKLSAFEERLQEWVRGQDTLEAERPQLHPIGYLDGGLHDRAITRDIEWGDARPVGRIRHGKRIYVWFEAVIGYLSAC